MDGHQVNSSKNGFNHGRADSRLFIQIEIAIGIEIELYLRRYSQRLSPLSCLSVYFSWRQESTKRTGPCRKTSWNIRV